MKAGGPSPLAGPHSSAVEQRCQLIRMEDLDIVGMVGKDAALSGDDSLHWSVVWMRCRTSRCTRPASSAASSLGQLRDAGFMACQQLVEGSPGPGHKEETSTLPDTVFGQASGRNGGRETTVIVESRLYVTGSSWYWIRHGETLRT